MSDVRDEGEREGERGDEAGGVDEHRAARGPRSRRRAAPAGGRSPLGTRQLLDLILRTYRASFPYVLLFVLVLLILTWVLTELIFR